MKIAIIGATGNVGQRLVAESLGRGHDVTAIARNIDGLPDQKGLRRTPGDVNDPTALAEVLRDHDVVVSTVAFRLGDPHKLLGAVRQSGVERYLVVGGAGSLWSKPGVKHIDTPQFPEFVREEASKGQMFLEVLLKEAGDLEWTMLSPSALFTAGDRTGAFRLGGDDLLVGADGKSWISYEDYSVALLDEVEQPQHVRRRFTVGY